MLWARVRRLWLCLPGVALLGFAVWAFGDLVFSLPTVVGSGGFMSVSTWLPLLWAVVLSDAFAGKIQSVEVRPGRRLALLDTGLFVALTILAASTFVMVGSLNESAEHSIAHLLLLSGLACSLTLLTGPGAATLACAALVVVTTPYGLTAWMAPYVRVLQPDGDAHWSLAWGVTAFAVACALMLSRTAHSRLGATQGLDE